MSVRADAESLRQIPIFRECDAVPLQVMAFAAERQNFLPGETIIAQGKKATSAFFLMTGTARVLTGEQEVGWAEPGALLGELAMISGALYAVTAIAAESVTAARIDNALFLSLAQAGFVRQGIRPDSRDAGESAGILRPLRRSG